MIKAIKRSEEGISLNEKLYSRINNSKMRITLINNVL